MIYEVWSGDEFITLCRAWESAFRYEEAGYRVIVSGYMD